MKRALIFGNTDFAEIASVYLRRDGGYDVAAFTVDQRYIDREEVVGISVVPFEHIVSSHPPEDFAFFVAVGFSKVNATRRAIFERCRALGYETPTYIHSTVQRWPETRIGDGCFIFEENVIQPFVSIGDNCVLWSGNHIGHHSSIGNNVFIASHAVVSGRCSIGDNSFLGVNATLRDGISVGNDCVIGAGALLLKDAVDGSVYKGSATIPYERSSAELRRF